MGNYSVLLPLLLSITLMALGQPEPVFADDLTLPNELLTDGLNARTTPLTNFQIPHHFARWDVKLLRLNEDAFIVNYTVGSAPPFQIQAIICSPTIGGESVTRVDATILGPTETADAFYDANLTFAFYPPDTTPPCMVKFMSDDIRTGWVERDKVRRDAYLTTSHDRAVRHMANWVQYLAENRDDRDRSAEFLASALKHEADRLRDLASGTDLKEAMEHLVLLERTLPASLFDLQLPLTSDQLGQLKRFLQLRLELQQKLATFSSGSDELIQRDQALLRKLGFSAQ